MSTQGLAARLRDLGTRQKRYESRELCEEARETLLRLDDRLLGAMTAQERSGAALSAERARSSLLAANQCDGPKVGDDHGNFHCKTVVDLRADNHRLRFALLAALSGLAAATSAYERHASRHRSVGRAVADPLFSTRLDDFKMAVEAARLTLGEVE